MKNSVVKVGIRMSAFLSLFIANGQVLAAEITVFNRGFETVLDTAWGRFGILVLTLIIVGLGYQISAGRKGSGERAVQIIIGILTIYGATELLLAFS